jgi:hypothetical protein
MFLPVGESAKEMFVAVAVQVDRPKRRNVLEVEDDVERSGCPLQQLQEFVPCRPSDFHVLVAGAYLDSRPS